MQRTFVLNANFLGLTNRDLGIIWKIRTRPQQPGSAACWSPASSHTAVGSHSSTSLCHQSDTVVPTVAQEDPTRGVETLRINP